MTTQANVRSIEGARSNGLLKNALIANAVFCTLSGLVLTFAAQSIAAFTGIPSALAIRITGIVLALYGADLAYFTMSKADWLRTIGVIAVIGDVAWVIGSVVLLVTGVLPLTTGGMWLIAILADIVAVFAIVQFVGLRRLQK